jgi:integration host factor subunit alpha
MTKKDIAKKLMEALPQEFSGRGAQLTFDFVPPVPKGFRRAEECVKAIISSIKHTLMAGEGVEVAGFGKFVIRQKKARLGRNPRTGEKALISARKVASFRPSKTLKKTVNGNQG